MMIDVSIATVFSEVYFNYFLSFSVFFQVFPASFVKKDNCLLDVLVLTKYVS